jgi:hypothetical protein
LSCSAASWCRAVDLFDHVGVVSENSGSSAGSRSRQDTPAVVFLPIARGLAAGRRALRDCKDREDLSVMEIYERNPAARGRNSWNNARYRGAVAFHEGEGERLVVAIDGQRSILDESAEVFDRFVLESLCEGIATIRLGDGIREILTPALEKRDLSVDGDGLVRGMTTAVDVERSGDVVTTRASREVGMRAHMQETVARFDFAKSMTSTSVNTHRATSGEVATALRELVLVAAIHGAEQFNVPNAEDLYAFSALGGLHVRREISTDLKDLATEGKTPAFDPMELIDGLQLVEKRDVGVMHASSSSALFVQRRQEGAEFQFFATFSAQHSRRTGVLRIRGGANLSLTSEKVDSVRDGLLAYADFVGATTMEALREDPLWGESDGSTLMGSVQEIPVGTRRGQEAGRDF